MKKLEIRKYMSKIRIEDKVESKEVEGIKLKVKEVKGKGIEDSLVS